MISIVTPCFNEEANVEELVDRVRVVMEKLRNYQYEHIFIDNSSADGTVAKLKTMASRDRRIKIIVNTRNFGPVRSPHHAFLQASGDAVISLMADLQDAPELILEFVRKWEEGYKIVVGVKTQSEESRIMYWLRGLYYSVIKRLAAVDMLAQVTGFGLYDRVFVDVLKSLREPYPFFRGLISEVGFDIFKITYTQRKRVHGISKHNFYTLFDIAMLSITNYSKIPLRFATLLGFIAAGMSFLVGLIYLIAKLLFWNNFTAGMAPLLIGLCFIGSVQLFFLGIVGEYVGAVFTYVQNRPLVVEKERINFDTPKMGEHLDKVGQ
jgi:glycosyltransferase involved in cell wall biosynthesis